MKGRPPTSRLRAVVPLVVSFFAGFSRRHAQSPATRFWNDYDGYCSTRNRKASLTQ